MQTIVYDVSMPIAKMDTYVEHLWPRVLERFPRLASAELFDALPRHRDRVELRFEIFEVEREIEHRLVGDALGKQVGRRAHCQRACRNECHRRPIEPHVTEIPEESGNACAGNDQQRRAHGFA